MGFLAPLALLGLLFVPLVLAFYMLRLRRDERVVSSTFLWQRLVRDVEANAPWQRLRRSLLLLLQLLLVVLIALVAAQPFFARPAGLGGDLVIVVDASASMAASDTFPSRLSAAKRAAIDALRDVPAEGRVSVIAAGDTARVVANAATDRGRVVRAIEGIAQSSAAGALGDGLKLAGALAARAHRPEVLVVTDDAAAPPPEVRLDVPVRVTVVGRERHNQAILALAVRAAASGLDRSVFVSVGNLDDARVMRRLQIIVDGVPITARDLALGPLSRSEVVINEIPPDSRVIEARLTVPTDGASGEAGPADQLALDDAAWAVVPADRVRRILLVGEGNVYLQNALSLLPKVELYGVTPAEYPTTTGKDLFDLFVFDGWLPPELPDRPVLAIAPPATSPLGTVTGTLEMPDVGEPPPDEPLLRDVDLSRLHVARAQRMELPGWARAVIPGGDASPLLYAGRRAGRPAAVLAFDLRESDLPLQVAWPILTSNLSGELLGLDESAAQPLRPGAAIELSLPSDAQGMRVTKPDGSVVELAPGVAGAASVTFAGTDQLGVYRSEPIRGPGPDGRGAAATASPTTPAPSPSGTPAGATAAGDAGRTIFVVDLLDADESNIAPGDGRRIAAIGRPRAAEPEDAVAHDEWWFPLALAILALLAVEWLVYERDGTRRLFGGLLARTRSLVPSRRRP